MLLLMWSTERLHLAASLATANVVVLDYLLCCYIQVELKVKILRQYFIVNKNSVKHQKTKHGLE